MAYILARQQVDEWHYYDEYLKQENAIARAQAYKDGGVYAIIQIDKWHAGDHTPEVIVTGGIVYKPASE